jgi:hypothetical protein
MYVFPDDPLHHQLEDAYRWMETSQELFLEAQNLIALSQPDSWISPAATAYAAWAEESLASCALSTHRAGYLRFRYWSFRAALVGWAYSA